MKYHLQRTEKTTIIYWTMRSKSAKWEWMDTTYFELLENEVYLAVLVGIKYGTKKILLERLRQHSFVGHYNGAKCILCTIFCWWYNLIWTEFNSWRNSCISLQMLKNLGIQNSTNFAPLHFHAFCLFLQKYIFLLLHPIPTRVIINSFKDLPTLWNLFFFQRTE